MSKTNKEKVSRKLFDFETKIFQIKSKYEKAEYKKCELLCSEILTKMDSNAKKNTSIPGINFDVAYVFCYRTLCRLHLNIDEALESANFMEFIKHHQILVAETDFKENLDSPKNERTFMYEFFYFTMLKTLENKKNYEKMKILIFEELPFLSQRSSQLQSTIKAKLAQLVIYGELSFPWPGLIISYLNSALKYHPHAYLILIEYQLNIGNLSRVEERIAEAKKVLKEIPDQSRLLVLQAKYHCNPNNPQIDFNKSFELFEKSIKLYPIPGVCFALAQQYEKDPELKISQDHIINLYKLAADTIPQAAHHLGFLYQNNNDLRDLEKAKLFYEKAMKFKYPYSCYRYALLLEQKPENLSRQLQLLTMAKSIPEACFKYVKLKLLPLLTHDVVFKNKLPPEKKINKIEGLDLYQSLQKLHSKIARSVLNFYAAIINEFILDDMSRALEHYRNAAEYGCELSHYKCYFIYCSQILHCTNSADEKFYIGSLQKILHSMEFFFDKKIPAWATPSFNKELFKQKYANDFAVFLEPKNIDAGYESSSDLIKIKNLSIPDRNKFIEIVSLNYDDIKVQHIAELVRYAGQLAHQLMGNEMAKDIDFFHGQLSILMTKIKKQVSNASRSNLWSLMKIFEGYCLFKIHSNDSDYIKNLNFLIKNIRNTLMIFNRWKLIMLIESVKNLCHKISFLKEFIIDIVSNTLTNFSELFTEIDASIQLCYNLAILENHYNFIKENKVLEPLLIQVLKKIINSNVEDYKFRLNVVRHCFFALTYFKNIKIIDNDITPLLDTLEKSILEHKAKTTCSKFQKNIVKFIYKYFCKDIIENKIKFIRMNEEKIVFTKSMDLVLTFSKPDHQTGSRVLFDVIIEADGPHHFWLPISSLKTQPIYDLDTSFYTTIFEQLGGNLIRIAYFNWDSLNDSQRYAYFQKQFKKFGLNFPDFSEIKSISLCSEYEDEDFDCHSENFQNQKNVFLINKIGCSSSLWWRKKDESKPHSSGSPKKKLQSPQLQASS